MSYTVVLPELLAMHQVGKPIWAESDLAVRRSTVSAADMSIDD
jgi:hypothetical protein